MMKKYFIDDGGINRGEVFSDDPVNPNGYSIVVLANYQEAQAVPKSCSSLEFMDRFTDPEQLAIVTATMAVPQVKLWYDRMIAATEIVYKDPRTLGGLQALSQGGLIAPNRVDEILPPEWR